MMALQTVLMAVVSEVLLSTMTHAQSSGWPMTIYVSMLVSSRSSLDHPCTPLGVLLWIEHGRQGLHVATLLAVEVT